MTQSTDGEEVSDRNDRRATHTNMIKTNIISDSIDIPNLLKWNNIRWADLFTGLGYIETFVEIGCTLNILTMIFRNEIEIRVVRNKSDTW